MSHMHECLLQRYSVLLVLTSDLETWLLSVLQYSLSPSSVLQAQMKPCQVALQWLQGWPTNKVNVYQCALSEEPIYIWVMEEKIFRLIFVLAYLHLLFIFHQLLAEIRLHRHNTYTYNQHHNFTFSIVIAIIMCKHLLHTHNKPFSVDPVCVLFWVTHFLCTIHSTVFAAPLPF